MDDTLSQYDESLEALERQRESLELVMQRMGEEWEESGAGIGWLRDSFYQAPTTNNNKFVKTNNNNTSSQTPNLSRLMQTVNTTGPSPDYLQTLLNVNDELVAQSLASLPPSGDTRDSSNDSNSFLVTLLPVSPPLSEDDPIPPPTVLRRQELSTPPITPD